MACLFFFNEEHVQRIIITIIITLYILYAIFVLIRYTYNVIIYAKSHI